MLSVILKLKKGVVNRARRSLLQRILCRKRLSYVDNVRPAGVPRSTGDAIITTRILSSELPLIHSQTLGGQEALNKVTPTRGDKFRQKKLHNMIFTVYLHCDVYDENISNNITFHVFKKIVHTDVTM